MSESRVTQKLTTSQAPQTPCWPNDAQWDAFNTSVSGKLIADTPLAESCYPGPAQDAKTCASMNKLMTDQSYLVDTPIGLSYPTESCPPVDITLKLPLKTCSIGDQPRYTVNATTVAEVAETVKYAAKMDLRLVVRNTGHDILRRSTGAGSLQVWIHHLKTGIKFQPKFQSTCRNSSWTGAAFSVGGGYTWEDVYPLAAANNVVVVGGGTPVNDSPKSLGQKGNVLMNLADRRRTRRLDARRWPRSCSAQFRSRCRPSSRSAGEKTY